MTQAKQTKQSPIRKIREKKENVWQEKGEQQQ